MNKLRAFTLIELMVVMAIILLVLAFVAPAVSGAFKGNKLTQAMQTVEGGLALARQTAITKNRVVEVRFYAYADPEVPNSQRNFRALRAFEVVRANVVNPLERLQTLPGSVIMDSKTVYSSILDAGKQRMKYSGTEPIPRVGTAYDYFAVRFRPDGTTDLSPNAGPWFLTLHDELKGDAPETCLPIS